MVNYFYTLYQYRIMLIDLCYQILAACQVVALVWFLDIVVLLCVAKRWFSYMLNSVDNSCFLGNHANHARTSLLLVFMHFAYVCWLVNKVQSLLLFALGLCLVFLIKFSNSYSKETPQAKISGMNSHMVVPNRFPLNLFVVFAR